MDQYAIALANAGITPQSLHAAIRPFSKPACTPTNKPANNPAANTTETTADAGKVVATSEARAAGEISADRIAAIQQTVAMQTNDMQSHFTLGIRPRIPRPAT